MKKVVLSVVLAMFLGTVAGCTSKSEVSKEQPPAQEAVTEQSTEAPVSPTDLASQPAETSTDTTSQALPKE